MKKINIIAMSVLVISIVAAGGYRLGSHRAENEKPSTANSEPKTENRKLLYYRNPMGLPDTSPVPKKDAMGMDYVAVYDTDAAAVDGTVSISVEKVQKLGVKTELASMRVLDKTIRASGRVEVNERYVYNIAPKFEGWIDKLHVNTTGEPVTKGQALFDFYSPELISAQREYAIAAQGVASLQEADSDTRRSMQQLAESSLLRLKNWDISAQQMPGLSKSGTVRRELTFSSPVNGIVLEKRVVQGMRFMPGEMLYQIADLSSLWVLADVAEQDIALVKVGSVARVSIAAYPGKEFEGKISFIYPTLNTTTRTVQVRAELANPGGQLKPAMYANVTLPTGNGAEVLAVPVSAVIDSGKRQVVLVQLAEGRFEPREVRLGNRSDDYVEVLEGVAEGERVVTSANFLIDAESNLKAALGGLGHSHGGGARVAKAQPDAEQAKPVNAHEGH